MALGTLSERYPIYPANHYHRSTDLPSQYPHCQTFGIAYDPIHPYLHRNLDPDSALKGPNVVTHASRYSNLGDTVHMWTFGPKPLTSSRQKFSIDGVDEGDPLLPERILLDVGEV